MNNGNGKILLDEDRAQFERELVVTPLSEIAPERVEWLWRQRIPRGKITLLAGDPGVGKSYASLAIAAAVTQGCALPDGDVIEPSTVLLWNGEDGPGDTIRPRAEACGVNLNRCLVIKGEREHSERFDLGSVDALRRTIANTNAALVVIDPLAALLAGVDSYKDADIRAALQPLADCAHEAGAAFLVVMHLRKAEAERALYRVGGSIGFVGLARSVLLCAADPEDGRRAIAPIKSNLSAAPNPVEYSIDGEGRFWWRGTTSELTAEHLLRPVRQSHAGAVDEAEQFLREVLANGPRPAREVEILREERMLSVASVKRARDRLGVVAKKYGGSKGSWLLSLSGKDAQDDLP